MLILNLKTPKYSQHISLSVLIKIVIPITQNGLLHFAKIGNYQQNFYVITQNNGKNDVLAQNNGKNENTYNINT